MHSIARYYSYKINMIKYMYSKISYAEIELNTAFVYMVAAVGI